jgi:hypothetical protein
MRSTVGMHGSIGADEYSLDAVDEYERIGNRRVQMHNMRLSVYRRGLALQNLLDFTY